jgi:hypothetical protein
MTPFRRTEVAICVRNSYIASIRVATVKHRGNQSGNGTRNRVRAKDFQLQKRRLAYAGSRAGYSPLWSPQLRPP